MCEAISESSMTDVFDNYIFRAASYLELIKESLGYAGCTLQPVASDKLYESLFGFKVTATDTSTKITFYAPDSPADVALISEGDEIVTAYGEPVKNNLQDLLLQHSSQELPLEIISNYKKKNIIIKQTDKNFYQNYKIVVNEKMTAEQKVVFNKWISAKY